MGSDLKFNGRMLAIVATGVALLFCAVCVRSHHWAVALAICLMALCLIEGVHEAHACGYRDGRNDHPDRQLEATINGVHVGTITQGDVFGIERKIAQSRRIAGLQCLEWLSAYGCFARRVLKRVPAVIFWLVMFGLLTTPDHDLDAFAHTLSLGNGLSALIVLLPVATMWAIAVELIDHSFDFEDIYQARRDAMLRARLGAYWSGRVELMPVTDTGAPVPGKNDAD